MKVEESYEVSKSIQGYIYCEIKNFINCYRIGHENHIGYLLYYPIIAIEKLFQDSEGHPEKFMKEQYAISWFVTQLYNEEIYSERSFHYIEEEFQDFKNNYLNDIANLYSDFIVSNEIKDLKSPTRYELIKIENDKYKLTWPLISGGFNKEYIYYTLSFEKDRLHFEQKVRLQANKRLEEIITNQRLKNINRLSIDIDSKLYDLCLDCVSLDLDKVGGNIKSKIINNIDDLKKVTAFFYYNSLIVNANYKIKNYNRKNPMKELVFYHDKEWLINKIVNVTRISEGKVEKYLDYFTFKGQGSFLEFPLIKNNEKIAFVPSSWLLNDFQFSIVNGHYFKELHFENRDKTISHSVVNDIVNKVTKYSNILTNNEIYYEFIDVSDNNKKVNSDIDVILYDKFSNTMLIIECKWKDNFYPIVGEENYQKIYNGLTSIYTNQISKHEKFVNLTKLNLNYLLKDEIDFTNIDEIPDVLYLVVDKRSQLFVEDKLLVPLYGLLALFEDSSSGEKLRLDNVVKVLRNMQTKVEYITSGDLKQYKINENISLFTEDLVFCKGNIEDKVSN